VLSPEYVTAIEDWLKWYNEHHNVVKGGSLERRVEFIEKGIKGAFIILAGLTYEVERVDLGKKAAGERRLVLPVSFR
jgi:hypothetical protein